MRSFRVIMAVVLTVVAGAALAKVGYNKAVDEAYKLKAGSAFDQLACLACHTPASKVNPYGADLKKAMTAAKAKALTAAVVKKIDGLDSDKDGAKNGAEIKAGTNPGDPKSKPAATPKKGGKKK
jgi:hypothetical protein